MKSWVYFLKNQLAGFLFKTGVIDHKIRSLAADQLLIMMYHRVIPPEMVDETIQPGMYVLPETFEQHMSFLKARFHICSIQELLERDTFADRPRCMITFDDGWHDFYDYAFPILKKHQVPATVFLPTGFIGTPNRFWSDRLALLLKNADTEKIQLKLNRQNNTLLEKVLSLHGNLSQRIDCAIELLKCADFENIQQVLTRLSEIGGGVDQNHKVFMTWDQVRELRQTELISFGSHTVHHQILTTLEKVKIKRELWESKQNLIREQAVAPNAISFCYPNGNYSNEIKKMVQEAGYAMACTTQAGINGPNSDRFALRRVGIHQDMGAHAGLLGCRLLGLL